MTGWAKDNKTLTWHFYIVDPRWADFSLCEKVFRQGAEVRPEPGSILVCRRCIRKMKRLVRKLERR